MTHATLPTLTVYYNTKCPVCNAGINHQKNRLLRAVRAGTIDFQDINAQPNALAPYGATVEDIRRRLHATDAAGTLFIGADCAIEIWRRTPGDAWLATLATLSRPLSRLVYDRFADLLYAWNRRKNH